MAVSTIDALYHSGSEKLTTSATGITVTGTVAATAYTGDGSALTGVGSPSIDDNGNATAITIDSSENVLANTTSTSVIGNGGFAIKPQTGNGTRVDISNNGEAMLLDGAASGSIIGLYGNGSSVGSIGVAASAKMSIIGTNNNLQIGADGSNIFNVSTASIYPDTDNSVDLGLSNRRFQEVHLSGAINQKNNTKIECINTQGNIGDLVFSTRYSTLGEKARITGLGSLLVGTTSDSNIRLKVYHGSNWAAEFGRQAGTHGVVRFTIGGTQCGSITANGSSTSYVTSSDYRLKENVVDLTGASARVNQLNPSRFNFIADTDTTVDGFLAHEVADVVPEAITGTKDEVEVWKDGEELPDGVSVGDNKLDDDGNTIPKHQGIDQSKLVPLLTAALQEALAEITSLKTRVEALEA